MPYFVADGGIEVQQLKTIESLRRVGVDVVLLDPWDPDITCDLVHVFGSEYGQAPVVGCLAARNIPIVTTGMFMPVQPPWKYVVYRMITKIFPYTILHLRRNIIRNSQAVITVTEWERDMIRRMLNVKDTFITTVPNGVDARYAEATKDLFVNTYGVENFVLCVSRIEPRKNQLRVARAMANSGITTVFIGSAVKVGSANERKYLDDFVNVVESSPNLHWLGGFKHDDALIPSAFAAARVHILATYNDAQGMVTTEASSAGCTIVVGDIPTQRELYGNNVLYVDPFSEASISAALKEAYSLPRGTKRVPSENIPTWDNVAKQILEVYTKVLKEHRTP